MYNAKKGEIILKTMFIKKLQSKAALWVVFEKVSQKLNK
jgi:hypothetical protein